MVTNKKKNLSTNGALDAASEASTATAQLIPQLMHASGSNVDRYEVAGGKR